jgi:hypothetical protein
MTGKLLSHAVQWVPDPRIDRIRRRLQGLVDPAQHGYSFALCRRQHPDGQQLVPRVVGVVTGHDACVLTHRMLDGLPLYLRLEANRDTQILSLCREPELYDEPVVGLILRFFEEDGSHEDVAASASCLPLDGLVFSTLEPVPPKGWPR